MFLRWATKSPVAAGVGLVVLGFIALFLAWNGAADKDYVEGQLPYLISGGMVGVGLIGAGLTVVNVQARRADQDALMDRIERLLEEREAQAPTAPKPSRTRQLSAAKSRRSA
jgi:Flp pilus assembly protein protease CpaA